MIRINKRSSVQLSSLSAPPGTLHTGGTFDPRDLPAAKAEPCPTLSETEEGPGDTLNDDVLLEILARLNGGNRLAVGSTCRRIRRLAHGTLKHVSIDVPPAMPKRLVVTQAGMASESGHGRERSGHDAPPSYGKIVCLARMSSVTLQLPSRDLERGAEGIAMAGKGIAERLTRTISGSCGKLQSSALTADRTALGDSVQVEATRPTDAIDLFLSEALSGNRSVPSLPLLEELRIKQFGNDNATCQISYDALAGLAVSAPRLRTLHLPLLSPIAADALSLLPRTLSCLSITVSDSPSIDHIVRMPNLNRLSISTREGLFYVVLSLSQVYDIYLSISVSFMIYRSSLYHALTIPIMSCFPRSLTSPRFPASGLSLCTTSS